MKQLIILPLLLVTFIVNAQQDDSKKSKYPAFKESKNVTIDPSKKGVPEKFQLLDVRLYSSTEKRDYVIIRHIGKEYFKISHYLIKEGERELMSSKIGSIGIFKQKSTAIFTGTMDSPEEVKFAYVLGESETYLYLLNSDGIWDYAISYSSNP